MSSEDVLHPLSKASCLTFHLQMFMIQHWEILLTKPNGMVMEVSGMLKLENPDKCIPLFAFIPHRL